MLISDLSRQENTMATEVATEARNIGGTLTIMGIDELIPG